VLKYSWPGFVPVGNILVPFYYRTKNPNLSYRQIWTIIASLKYQHFPNIKIIIISEIIIRLFPNLKTKVQVNLVLLDKIC